MSLREWLLPLVLGGLAAGAVYVLPSPGLPEHDPLPAASPEPLGLAWPFREAVAPADTTVSLLAVGRPGARELALACPDGDRVAPLVRETDAVWRLDVPAGCRSHDGALRVDEADNGTLFGADGHDAVRVTLYVLDEGGELLASNAGATQRNRFRLYGDFVTVSDAPWYLGGGPAPEGMRVPTGYVDFARERLSGLPLGAVATAHVPQHEYDWLTGPLWVTVRVDAFSCPCPVTTPAAP